MGQTHMQPGGSTGRATCQFCCVMSECPQLCSSSHLVFQCVLPIVGMFNINQNTRNLEWGTSCKSIHSIIYLHAYLVSEPWKWKPDLPSPGWVVSVSSLLISDIASLLSANGLGSEGARTCFSRSELVQTFLEVSFPGSPFLFSFLFWVELSICRITKIKQTIYTQI